MILKCTGDTKCIWCTVHTCNTCLRSIIQQHPSKTLFIECIKAIMEIFSAAPFVARRIEGNRIGMVGCTPRGCREVDVSEELQMSSAASRRRQGVLITALTAAL